MLSPPVAECPLRPPPAVPGRLAEAPDEPGAPGEGPAGAEGAGPEAALSAAAAESERDTKKIGGKVTKNTVCKRNPNVIQSSIY